MVKSFHLKKQQQHWIDSFAIRIKKSDLAKSVVFYRKISISIRFSDDSLTIRIEHQCFVFFPSTIAITIVQHLYSAVNLNPNTMNWQLACKSQKEQTNKNISNEKSHWIDGIQVFFYEFEHIFFAIVFVYYCADGLKIIECCLFVCLLVTLVIFFIQKTNTLIEGVYQHRDMLCTYCIQM